MREITRRIAFGMGVPGRWRRDEAPEVYKRLPDVLAAHGDTIRVKPTRPVVVAMAGREMHDPYKD